MVASLMKIDCSWKRFHAVEIAIGPTGKDKDCGMLYNQQVIKLGSL